MQRIRSNGRSRRRIRMQLLNSGRWMKRRETFNRGSIRTLKIVRSSMKRCNWLRIWLISIMRCLRWFVTRRMASSNRNWTWAQPCSRKRTRRLWRSKIKHTLIICTRRVLLWCKRLSIIKIVSSTKPRLSIECKAKITLCSWSISIDKRSRRR